MEREPPGGGQIERVRALVSTYIETVLRKVNGYYFDDGSRYEPSWSDYGYNDESDDDEGLDDGDD